MRIALDWDDTYTADPGFWDAFIDLAKLHGHKVVICSCRTPEWAAEAPMETPSDTAVFLTSFGPKRPYMEKMGLPVDVWIDDCPESVKEGR